MRNHLVFETLLAWMSILFIFRSKEISSQYKFYIPQIFSRYDLPNTSLYLNAGEKFNMFSKSIKPDSHGMNENKVHRKSHVSAKKLSVCLSIVDPNVKLPEKPSDLIISIIKKRGLLEIYNQLNKVGLCSCMISGNTY